MNERLIQIYMYNEFKENVMEEKTVKKPIKKIMRKNNMLKLIKN